MKGSPGCASREALRWERAGPPLAENWRVLLVGLDAAGKTTLLFRLYAGKTLNTIPTVGFNMKTVRIQGLNMNIWDVGGQD